MATYTIDFKYDDGEDSHYEAETEQGVKDLINHNLGKPQLSGLMSITITVE